MTSSNDLFYHVGCTHTVMSDHLFQVFSAFGTVQKIAIFEKNGGMQALIQYPGSSSIPMLGYLPFIISGHLLFIFIILILNQWLFSFCNN